LITPLNFPYLLQMQLSGVMVDGRSGPLGRCDALFDGPADPFAQVLNAVEHILAVLGGPALEPLGQFRQVGLFPADPEAPAQDVGHTLGTEFTLLPAVRSVKAPVVIFGGKEQFDDL